MNELHNGTWVLVADSEKALFLENVADAQNPHLVVIREEEQENPSDRSQSANRPGRMQDTGVQQRSALDDTDWHELAKERFAAELSEILYKKAHRGEFDRIIIACPPQLLGELRRDLHKEVSSRVVGEVHKLLTNHPLDKMEAILKEELEAA
ncbi:Host attachment protein [Maritimibacter sp. DP07]|jgi:protein required for attachment to host cells|uniref:Host attachment protein n=1 Tax=Maritimibacter harenae TaxID=2606218 RepID=A0A845M5K0_9RHOB|nr:host attachment family protein [Maritimibacter harenae]MZR12987.1 Host attachment protein [Maritimibacter harenae]